MTSYLRITGTLLPLQAKNRMMNHHDGTILEVITRKESKTRPHNLSEGHRSRIYPNPLYVVDLNDQGNPYGHSRMTQEGVNMIRGWPVETIRSRCWRMRTNENEAEILYRALH